MWYILKQLFTSVSVKVVDIYFYFGNYLLVINVVIIHDVTYNREKCMLITKGYSELYRAKTLLNEI